MKAVEIHLAAGQESLQEIDPALLEVLRDRGFGLGWEPVLVHASRLSPDARTGIRAGPARGPGAHLQFAIARTRSHYDPRNCYRSPCPTARVSAELPLALLEETDQAGGQRLPRSLPADGHQRGNDGGAEAVLGMVLLGDHHPPAGSAGRDREGAAGAVP